MMMGESKKYCSLSQRIHKIAATNRNAWHFASALATFFKMKDEEEEMLYLLHVCCRVIKGFETRTSTEAFDTFLFQQSSTMKVANIA